MSRRDRKNKRFRNLKLKLKSLESQLEKSKNFDIIEKWESLRIFIVKQNFGSFIFNKIDFIQELKNRVDYRVVKEEDNYKLFLTPTILEKMIVEDGFPSRIVCEEPSKIGFKGV